MKKWKAKNNPIPDKTDNLKMKEFMRLKYVVKQFAEVEESDDDDSDSSEEQRRKERKRKKEKKRRKEEKAAKKAKK